MGQLDYLALSFLKEQYEVVCFADKNSNTIGNINNIPVVSVEEAVEKYKDAIFIVGSNAFKTQMRDELKELGVAEENILIPKYQYLMTMFGNQYFDVYEPEEEEVFVDAGAFDGSTTLAFKQWSRKENSKSYIIEPISNQCEKIKERIEREHWSNCEVVPAAVWNKNEELHFCAAEAGSMVSDCGISVEGKSIDDIVGNNKVTYIKMDVEGAELNALHGAQHTIKTQKPRLAICIYHKPEDVWTIPLYLLELVPEYRFKIRHYTSREWETVLYASIAD